MFGELDFAEHALRKTGRESGPFLLWAMPWKALGPRDSCFQRTLEPWPQNGILSPNENGPQMRPVFVFILRDFSVIRCGG
jgi:hypothetical protein